MNRRTFLKRSAYGSLAVTAGVAAMPKVGLAGQTGTPASDITKSGGPVLGNPAFEPAVDPGTAQETALKEYDGAAVESLELEGHNGVLTYDVELDNGVDVRIDATTGDVISTDHDDDDDSDDDHSDSATRVVGNPTLAPEIDLAKAQQVALKDQADARVESVELEGKNGVLVWMIELDNDIETVIDSTTGDVIETKQDDDHGDDDDDDDNDEHDDDDD